MFFSETTLLIEAKFHMEHPFDEPMLSRSHDQNIRLDLVYDKVKSLENLETTILWLLLKPKK